MKSGNRSRTAFGVFLIVLALLVSSCGGGGSGSGSGSSSSSAQPSCNSETSTKKAGCDQFKVLNVKVYKNTITQTNTTTWKPVVPNDKLTTDISGEAELNFSSCYPLPLYLFKQSNSSIQVSECRKNTTQSTACLDYGTIYANCPGEFTVSTNNAYITKNGTVYSITYLDERDVTLVIVFDGEAMVLPVRSYGPVEYGAEIDVPVGYFTFVTDGAVGGLDSGAVYPIEELPRIVPELDIFDWMRDLGDKAQQDDLLPPAWPPDWTSTGTREFDCRSEEDFCVGLVADVGGLDNNPFYLAAWEGLKQAEAELGAFVQLSETADLGEFGKNVAAFADQGYDVVVTVGLDVADATTELAFAYPETRFVGVDQVHSAYADNLTSITFPEDQAGFLVGALAAMITRTGVIGAVCGIDDVPPVWRYGEGYRSGAAYINQNVQALVVYHNDVEISRAFSDPSWGAEVAGSLIDEGADVIFGCGGATGDGALRAAAEYGIYAIGVDVDQYFTLPDVAPRMLSSATKQIAPSVFEVLRLTRNGNFPSGVYIGQPGYAPFHELTGEVSGDVVARLEEIRVGLINGSLRTFVPETKP